MCFSIMYGMSSFPLTFIFFRGVETTNQISIGKLQNDESVHYFAMMCLFYLFRLSITLNSTVGYNCYFEWCSKSGRTISGGKRRTTLLISDEMNLKCEQPLNPVEF